jgi:hypothetical protein
MAIQSNFYVYEHRRKDTGAVFYVGKGCGKRAGNFSSRNRLWKQMAADAGGASVGYVVDKVDEEFSFLVEQEYIDKLRRIGAKLANLTDGGEGNAGAVRTEDMKRKYAAAKIGKKRPADVVARMRATKTGKNTGADNPFFGRKHTDETKARLRITSGSRKHTEEEKRRISESVRATYASLPRSRPVLCLTNGLTYFSLGEAARQLGLRRRCITMVCNKEMHHTAGMKFEWSMQ